MFVIKYQVFLRLSEQVFENQKSSVLFSIIRTSRYWYVCWVEELDCHWISVIAHIHLNKMNQTSQISHGKMKFEKILLWKI